MATIRKCLAQISPLSNTLTDAYIVPALTEVVVSAIWVCNTNPSLDANFSISFAIGGAVDNIEQYLLSLVPIGGGDSWEATVGITASASDVIRVLATQSNIAFQFFGTEIS